MSSADSSERFIRSQWLIGEENVFRLRRARVAIFGIGGVGGYAAEALARSGIGSFALIDPDKIELSNCNRQLVAAESTLGQNKTYVMSQRIRDINPEAIVREYPIFYSPQTDLSIKTAIFEQCDFIVDAIDCVGSKIDLAVEANNRNIPIVSAMGCGRKIDAARFEIADIFQTSVCPLCRIMRSELRKREINSLTVVYSAEPPITQEKTTRRTPGSLPWTPGVAGLLLAQTVVRGIIGM